MEQYIKPAELRRYLKAMELFDAVMTPPKDDWLRIIMSEKSKESNNLTYFIRNGSGDELLVDFGQNGVLIKGFDHENELNQFAADKWDSSFFEHIFSDIPKEFIKWISEDELDETTFCMWYLNDTEQWYQNEIDGNDGGKSYLLGYIHLDADSFAEWAEEYYEKDIDISIIKKLFESGSLTEEDIMKLNPECNAKRVLDSVH